MIHHFTPTEFYIFFRFFWFVMFLMLKSFFWFVKAEIDMAQNFEHKQKNCTNWFPDFQSGLSLLLWYHTHAV